MRKTVTVKGVLENSLEKYSDRALMKFKDKELTYRKIDQLSKKFSNSLLDLGLESRDRIATLMFNRPEGIIGSLAMIRSGLTTVGLNPLLNKSDLKHIMRDSEAKAVIADSMFLEFVREKKDSIDNLEYILGIPTENRELPDEVHNFHKLVEQGNSVQPSFNADPDDIAFLAYTGGTTGKPKGVKHSHYGLATSAISHVLEYDITKGEKMLLMTPLIHAAGLIFFGGMIKGSTIVVTPSFDADKALELIEREKVSLLWIVPTMLYRMLDSAKIKKLNLSSINTIIYGAAPMSHQRLKEGINVFGNVFMQLYGLSETLNPVSTLTKEDHEKAMRENKELLKSAGRTALMCQTKIVDKDGEEVEVNEPGVVMAKTPYQMVEYWELPEKTKDTLKEGWIRTGDIGYKDEEGYLYLMDREKDMIVSGGYNVYSTKVEQAVQKHPDVAMVAVIPVPDPEWGEAVKAIVQLKEGAEASSEEIKEFCEKHLAKYEKPKSVDFVDELPLTVLGKVDKRALREPYWKDQERKID